MVAERRLPEGKLYAMDTTATDIFYYNQDSQVSKVSTQFLKTLVANGLTIEGATTSSPLPKQVTDDIANQVVARIAGRYSYGAPAVGNALRVYGRNTLLRLAGKLLATRALEPVFLRAYYYVIDNKGRLGGMLKNLALKKLKRQK